MEYIIARLERGRDHAAARRHRGLHTGKSAKGWDTVRRELEAGTWDWHFGSAKSAVRFAISVAQEEYRRAVFPERYGDETLDDVIAAQAEADRDALLATF